MSSGRLANEYVHSSGRKVHEVMTRDPRTVVEDTPVEQIVQVMERHRIKRLPVLRGDAVVGIIETRANLVHALVSLALEAKPSAAKDSVIRGATAGRIGSAILGSSRPHQHRGQERCRAALGTITDKSQRQALIVAAENTPGVRRVEDHLVWMDPMSGWVFAPPEQAKVSSPRRVGRNCRHGLHYETIGASIARHRRVPRNRMERPAAGTQPFA